METKKIVNIEELMGYEEDSVKSKTIITKPKGSVTLFGFDKGQGISEHTSPFDAFVHILDGLAEISISGEKYKLTKGDILIMPANEPHALYALEKFRMMLFMIKS